MSDKCAHEPPQVLELSQSGMNALDESIRRWRKKAMGIPLTTDDFGCPLCMVYGIDNQECRQCPVRLFTGAKSCYATVFYAWEKAKTDMLERRSLALEMYELLQEIRRHCVLKGESAIDAELRSGIENIIIEQINRWGRDIKLGKLIAWMDNDEPRFEKVVDLFTDVDRQAVVQFQDHSCKPLDRCRLATPEEVSQYEENEKAARRKAEGWGIGIEKDKWVIWSPGNSLFLVERVGVFSSIHKAKIGNSWVSIGNLRLATVEEMYQPGAKVKHKDDTLTVTGLVDSMSNGLVVIHGSLLKFSIHHSLCTLMEAAPKQEENKLC